MFRIISFGAVFILAACASTGIDKSYLDGLDKSNSAQLRLASGDKSPGTFMNAGPTVAVRKYTDETCVNEKTVAKLRNGPFGGAKQNSLNMALNDFHKNAATETYIEANKPVTFLFHQETNDGTTVVSCGSIVQTTFEAGKDYELSIDFVPSTDDIICKVDLNEIVTTASGSTRNFIKSFDNSAEGVSQQCLNAFQKTRWF